jgi:hypothetical protein
MKTIYKIIIAPIVLVFFAVEKTLRFIAKITKTTYQEVNVIIYYHVIPVSFLILMECYRIAAAIWLCYLIVTTIMIIRNTYHKNCQKIFDKSVNFLLLFGHSNTAYIISSVIVCVIMPILIYILIFLIKP